MELRKVEQELEKLSSEWKALRRKRPRFHDDDAGPLTVADDTSISNGALSTRMPSWKELKSKVNDDDLFPSEEEEPRSDVAVKEESGSGTDTTNNINSNDVVDGDTTGYSEFGMCLAPSSTAEVSDEGTESKASISSAGKNGGSIFEKYAAKSVAKSKDTVEKKASAPMQTVEDVKPDEEEPIDIIEDAEPTSILAELESLHGQFLALGPKIEKFMTKLKERDPVTKKPRYGAKTLPRVKNVIRTYKALEQGVAVVFQDTDTGPSLVSSLQSKIQQQTEKLNAQKEARQSKQQLEAERLAKEKLAAEARANQQRLLEEQKKLDEERELARRAEEARQRRIEEEQRALDAEHQADQELLDLVPTLGVEGVREQIGRMRESLKDDKAAFDVALGSLYTLFEQIVRKPEEINFRRVRRDHPKFMEDIGRHVGGREVLIAAGFKLDKLDGVPCFFSKEPHIESDMDGWSDWFDTLKKTLEVIEEEMLK